MKLFIGLLIAAAAWALWLSAQPKQPPSQGPLRIPPVPSTPALGGIQSSEDGNGQAEPQRLNEDAGSIAVADGVAADTSTMTPPLLRSGTDESGDLIVGQLTVSAETLGHGSVFNMHFFF